MGISTTLLPLQFLGGQTGTVAAVVAGVVVVIFIFVALLASRYRKVGPNQTMVISGRGRRGFRVVAGGGAFIWPIVEKVDLLSMELMTLDVTTPEVYTIRGVPVIVDGVAQVKVRSDEASIRTSAQQFLSKGGGEIMSIAQLTLEGHLRAILGTMTVEEIYQNRDAFAQRVQEVAAGDMANMGLEIVSFTIRDIKDNQGYLAALGKPRTAEVKRDAVIAQAEADRDAQIRSAQARRDGETAEIAAKTKIAEADRDYKIKQAEYDQAAQLKRAEADQAYALQTNRAMQSVKAEEVQVEIVERERRIELQNKEIERKERELNATIRKPAEAERFRVEQLADAEKYRIEANALGQANAEKSRGFADADVVERTGDAEASAAKAKGLATADVIKATGMSEAEAMRKKAESFALYNEAAVTQMLIDVLPRVAEAVAAPLAKTERIVIIGGGSDGAGAGASKITRDVTDIVAQLPPVLESLTGLQLRDLISRVPGLGEKLREAVPPPTPKKPAS
ncbi:flotillin family protein [Candidatus Sumerlaeota bacterium]|nr:flotillin family protein [Candidatus Sumerlaeota bacterium]